jgi:hypothetical protein
MTTKPKPRKRAAKAAPFKPAPAGTPREVSEIERLFTRYKWLEADCEYQSKMASTDEESDALINVHNRARDKIESRLAELRPMTIREAELLLEFVRQSLEMGKRTDDMDIRIVANVRDSLIEVRRNIEKKARDEAYKESLEHAVEAAMKIVGLQSKYKRLSAEPKKTPVAA